MSAQRGVAHHKARLTEAQVEEMRAMYEAWKAAGEHKGYRCLEVIYGTSMWTCRDIVTYRTRI